MQQTFYQTLDLTIHHQVIPDAPNTGLGGITLGLWIAVLIGTMLVSAGLWALTALRPAGAIGRNQSYSRSHRGLRRPLSSSIPLRPLAVIILALGLCLATVLYIMSPSRTAGASSTLTFLVDAEDIPIELTNTGSSATAHTQLTTATTNPTGYTLTAAVEHPEDGITIHVAGGDLASHQSPHLLTHTPLTIRTTDAATPETGHATPLTLSLTADSTVTPGTKQLRLVYTATINPNDDTDTTEQLPTTMQSFTTSHCDTLPTYTGINQDALLTLTDTRGTTPDDYQTYQVAKLADGNCWMIDNLKLGSTTSTLALTPSDTNVAANFTLPQVSATHIFDTTHYDNPYVHGPVPGDTGEGVTNYGYLYNWSAATAGESRDTIPGDGTNNDTAPYSICPVGWRLPTTYYNEDFTSLLGDYPDLDRAFGGTGAHQNSGPSLAQWQYDGVFRGVLAGFWVGSFNAWAGSFGAQTAYGVLWSASAVPGMSDFAFVAAFDPVEVYPGYNGNIDRYNGLGVRCLLN